MCGIAGIFAYTERAPLVDEAELLRIREHMMKRGPDGAGLWISADRKVGLAHRRLAIIDLSETGAQPMATPDGRLTITFNGEIYNYRELRRELEAKGYGFRSQSDTEVLLHLYAERGAEMVHALRGMFTFGIWDARDRRLFLARDPFGIKPLYYADDGNTFRFASQVKALLAGGCVDTALEPAGSAGFLIWGCVPEPFTLYRGIQALAAGTHLTLKAGRASVIATHFNVRDELVRAQEEARPFRASDRGTLAELLHGSVRHHLVSDVPVGIFLSSGVDSTLVAGLAMAEAGTRLRSLTLGFEEYRGTAEDEAPLAERTAASLRMSHELHEIRRSDFATERDSILAAMDQPTTDGVNTYFVCRAAARAGIKVALSGLGGDELFGGYPSFRDVPRMVRWLRPASMIPGFGGVVRHALAPGLSAFTSPKYASLLEYGGSVEGAYLLRRALYMPWEIERTLDPDATREGLEKLQTMASLAGAVRGVQEKHSSVAALELSWYMRNQLLRDADWAGMAHSLEVRVPLVDVRLFRGIAPWLASASPPTKADMAASVEVPTLTQALARPKSGFAVPVRDWGERPSSGDNAVNRGVRGWARVILRRQTIRPLRVLVSTLFPSHGGVRSMTAKMVQLLRRRGYAVELAHYMPYRMAPKLSVPVWMLPFRAPGVRNGIAFGDIRTHEIGTRLPELEWYRCLPSRAWRSLAQRFDYCIAVSGSALAALPVLLQGRGCLAWIATPYFPDKADRARTYPWYRKLVDFLFDTPVSRRFEKMALRRADVLALSAYTADELRRVVPEVRCEVMPMPIDAQVFFPTRTRSLPGNRVGFCGRFSDPRKNIHLLLETVARCRDLGLELQCSIAGDQPTPEIRRAVQRLGLQPYVQFFGEKNQEELRAFYNDLDVFVVPSAQEGLAIVGLEAMACGCPVVSTRCGGPQEYVEDGVNGFLVGFSPDELAAALKQVLGDPALHRRMSEAALLTVRQGYSEEKVQRILWNTIDRMIDQEGDFPGMNENLLITGGAGFIGVNAAAHFARSGWRVTVLDNMSRRGAEANLAWLQETAKVEFLKCDIRDAAAVAAAVAAARPSGLLHLAAQVAVTTSVTEPRHDFETNALGTFNVLEAVRRESPDAVFVYASTNKVYGKLDSYAVAEKGGRYAYRDHPEGVPEDCQLDFHSPYGCSKGAADQYVLDYARIYGLRATAFRQSCIYGPHQFGVEDQGWVAWFTIAATLGWPITIFGDGKQVRDVLHVDDLSLAYEAAFREPGKVMGEAFNIGGGPDKTMSLLELIEMLTSECGRPIRPAFQDWRPGDQKIFVCDIAKAKQVFGWSPRMGVADGVRSLIEWVAENRRVLEHQHSLA